VYAYEDLLLLFGLKPLDRLASRNVSGDNFLGVGGGDAAIPDFVRHDHNRRTLLAEVEALALFDYQLVAVVPFSSFVKGLGDILTASLGALFALGANEDFDFFAHETNPYQVAQAALRLRESGRPERRQQKQIEKEGPDLGHQGWWHQQ